MPAATKAKDAYRSFLALELVHGAHFGSLGQSFPDITGLEVVRGDEQKVLQGEGADLAVLIGIVFGNQFFENLLTAVRLRFASLTAVIMLYGTEKNSRLLGN